VVLAVVFTGPNRPAQWPGSGVISAMKANTANAFSTNNFARSTGNIFAGAQLGGFLYGINTPPNPNVAYAGNPQEFGMQNDPMIGKAIGGVIVFGAACHCIARKANLSGDSASVEIPLAPTMLSPGKGDAPLGLTRCRWASPPAQAIISFSTFRTASAAAASAIPTAKADRLTRPSLSSLSKNCQ
jgi:hypothetical protein